MKFAVFGRGGKPLPKTFRACVCIFHYCASFLLNYCIDLKFKRYQAYWTVIKYSLLGWQSWWHRRLLSYSEIFAQLLLNLFTWCEQIGVDKQNAALEGTLMLLMVAIHLSLTLLPPYYWGWFVVFHCKVIVFIRFWLEVEAFFPTWRARKGLQFWIAKCFVLQPITSPIYFMVALIDFLLEKTI